MRNWRNEWVFVSALFAGMWMRAICPSQSRFVVVSVLTGRKWKPPCRLARQSNFMQKVNAQVRKLRRRKTGRVVVSEFYHLFWSVKGHGQGQFSLNVRELQAAEKLKTDFIRVKERELCGLLAPRLERDAAGQPLTEHLAGFLAYLQGLNRSASHISHVGTRVRKLMADCGWRSL